MTSERESSDRLIAQNRRASHDYFILDTLETGLVLVGTEVKSLRAGKASLAEAYATIDNGEVFVRQMHIPPYVQGNRWNVDPVRTRKLLVHRAEIAKLQKAVAQKGHTLVPLKLYFKGPWAKVLLGVGRGKSHEDKRETVKRREADREMERALRRAR